MPQWLHELLVPQPPGMSLAWMHCNNSPGRNPRASPLLASPPALTKESLQYTIWRWGFSSAIMPGELSSIAISTGDSPTCVASSSIRGRAKRPAGRKRVSVGIVARDVPPPASPIIGFLCPLVKSLISYLTFFPENFT